MKVVRTEIAASLNSYLTVIERNESYFKTPLHAHPELELVYVEEGFGKRVIGNKIDHFEAGDMVFVGSNVPHVWLNDEVFYKGFRHLRAKSIVMYFNLQVFSQMFYNMQEVRHINLFFQQAQRGIAIYSKTRDLLVQKLKTVIRKTDFERIIGLLEIINILSSSSDIDFICDRPYSLEDKLPGMNRVADIHRYINEHYGDEITLAAISKVFNITPQSFCRFFKKNTGKHFMAYLHEVRVSRACRYLEDTDWPVSQIAYTTGFKTLSHFNKLFKEVMRMPPGAYREKYKG